MAGRNNIMIKGDRVYQYIDDDANIKLLLAKTNQIDSAIHPNFSSNNIDQQPMNGRAHLQVVPTQTVQCRRSNDGEEKHR